jgi:hypothetical protein
MTLVWILVAFWLVAAVLLPLHVLFEALSQSGRRILTPTELKELLLTPRSC